MPVDPPLRAGKVKVWPVVHLEDNGNERFDYPAADAAATIESTGVIVVPIEITVAATPAKDRETLLRNEQIVKLNRDLLTALVDHNCRL